MIKIELQLEGMSMPIMLEVVKLMYLKYSDNEKEEYGGMGFVSFRQPDLSDDVTIDIESIESIKVVDW